MVFSNNLLLGAAGQGGGYEIDQSIRFNDNDSAYHEPHIWLPRLDYKLDVQRVGSSAAILVR